MMAAQPIGARSLNMDIAFYGVYAVAPYRTPCAVCSDGIAAGSRALVRAPLGTWAHVACGEPIGRCTRR